MRSLCFWPKNFAVSLSNLIVKCQFYFIFFRFYKTKYRMSSQCQILLITIASVVHLYSHTNFVFFHIFCVCILFARLSFDEYLLAVWLIFATRSQLDFSAMKVENKSAAQRIQLELNS